MVDAVLRNTSAKKELNRMFINTIINIIREIAIREKLEIVLYYLTTKDLR